MDGIVSTALLITPLSVDKWRMQSSVAPPQPVFFSFLPFAHFVQRYLWPQQQPELEMRSWLHPLWRSWVQLSRSWEL